MLKAQFREQVGKEATTPVEEQVIQEDTSTTGTKNISENPQVIEIPSYSFLSVEQSAPLESHNPSVISPLVVIQDSAMQSQTNMSDFLRASTAEYNLLNQFMTNMETHMDKEFKAYLSQKFNCDSAMIECFNTLLLADEIAFGTFID